MIQYKTLEHEVKDLDDKGVVTFYFNSFNIEDSDKDISHPGSFKKTMNENIKRIRHFKNHTLTAVPGVIKEMGEDTFGAWARSQLILGTKEGDETYLQYKAGAITEHSFGYDVIDRDKQDKRVIKEYRLWEVSSLTGWGANEVTPVIDVKSDESMLKELDKLLKLKRENFTDDFLQKVEQKINYILEHISSLRNESVITNSVAGGNAGEPNAFEYLLNNLKMLK